MTRRSRPMALIVIAVVLVVAAGALLVPVSVRHNAPLGVSRTIDSSRGIAVRGGYVVPNYDGFDRLELDIRAYDPFVAYDFVVHVRPAGPDQPDVRTMTLGTDWEGIWHQKPALENPYLSLRFPAIDDAAGKRFYVWVEAGPQNRNDIWTLWRIKSYSTVPAWEVIRAWIESAPPPLGRWPGAVAIAGLIVGAVAAFGWFVAGLVRLGLQSEPQTRC